MEIPELINVLNGYEAGMKFLQNPSLISRFFSWSALILAVLATFTSIIRSGKIILVHLRVFELSPQASVQSDDDFEFSDDDDDYSSVSSEEEEGGKSPETTRSKDQQDVVDVEEYDVKGSKFYLKLQRQNSILSQFTCRKNVVKLWEGLGLGLDFFEENNNNNDSGNTASIWDFDQNEMSGNFSGLQWNIRVAGSPKMVFTAKYKEMGDGVVLEGYDMRIRGRAPAVSAKWCIPAAAHVAEMSTASTISRGSVEKVYLNNKVSGVLTVGDLRNFKSPVGNAFDVIR